jgi:thiol-disulfide isomerase/thioredoxin
MTHYILLLFLITYSLQSNGITTITSLQEFKEAVRHEHDPVCAFIVADWCSICKEIKPHIQTIVNNPEINSKIDFIHVSFDAIPELATEFLFF